MASVVTREEVMQALFTRLQGCVLRGTSTPSFVTVERQWNTIKQYPQAARPALLQLEEDETITRQRAGMPPRRLTMHCQLLIYAWSGGLAVPSAVLNPLLDSVDDVLTPFPALQPSYRQTLSGTSYDAWISGRIIKIPGYRDGQAAAVIPVQILVP